MEKLNLLGKAEMKKVKGGIMSPEATYQWCLDHIIDDYTGESDLDSIIQSVSEEACWKGYLGMLGNA
jgi:hypothetical protein